MLSPEENHGLTGAILKKWREEQRLSQDEIGDLLGLSREWIGKLERDEKPVSAKIFLKFERLKREPRFTKKETYSVAGPHDGSVAEDPGVTPPTSSRMMIVPRHALPADQPSQEQCLQHFTEYLARASEIPGGLGHTWVQLQFHFSLADLDRLAAATHKPKSK